MINAVEKRTFGPIGSVLLERGHPDRGRHGSAERGDWAAPIWDINVMAHIWAGPGQSGLPRMTNAGAGLPAEHWPRRLVCLIRSAGAPYGRDETFALPLPFAEWFWAMSHGDDGDQGIGACVRKRFASEIWDPGHEGLLWPHSTDCWSRNLWPKPVLETIRQRDIFLFCRTLRCWNTCARDRKIRPLDPGGIAQAAPMLWRPQKPAGKCIMIRLIPTVGTHDIARGKTVLIATCFGKAKRAQQLLIEQRPELP